MIVTTELALRIVGAIAGAIGFGILGSRVSSQFDIAPTIFVALFLLFGVIVGFAVTPYMTIRPLRSVIRSLVIMPGERLIAVIIGLFIGLVAAALVSLPLSLLPSPLREILPVASAIVLCYLSVVLLTARHKDLGTAVGSFRPQATQASNGNSESMGDVILMDTSVIIDGRITDISHTGFIRATLLVPNFILSELQHIADSADTLRRNRGRRGLDVLSILQNESPVPVRITDQDVSDVRDADSKLVALARQLHCPIITNDYNLNRVAELQGVTVMNINDLANAVKASLLPGEALQVKIIQEGKEIGQGVGYLEDGTMVVVEDGSRLINRTEDVVVTKVLQTAAGRMIFAKI